MQDTGSILQLKLSLDGSRPIIWRRILVKRSMSMFELHIAFQIVMGWENYHLFEFAGTGRRIGIPDPDGETRGTIDSRLITIGALDDEALLEFKYIYDFGDDWIHTVKIEKSLTEDESIAYPLCLEGKMNGPPEDCGGIMGFYDYLKALHDPSDPSHEDMLHWRGGYDPEFFDILGINRNLQLARSAPNDSHLFERN